LDVVIVIFDSPPTVTWSGSETTVKPAANPISKIIEIDMNESILTWRIDYTF
jgi:hypothetical protein